MSEVEGRELINKGFIKCEMLGSVVFLGKLTEVMMLCLSVRLVEFEGTKLVTLVMRGREKILLEFKK